jgi:hypothetical protein
LRYLQIKDNEEAWGLIGCIVNKNEDPSFYRKFMKSFLKKSPDNMYIVMLLGNAYSSKSQTDLALKHYWAVY